MTIGITKMQARLVGAIEFIGRQIIAQKVAAIVGEPKLFGHRMPSEADAISNSARENFEICSVGFHAHQAGVRITFVANVARGPLAYTLILNPEGSLMRSS